MDAAWRNNSMRKDNLKAAVIGKDGRTSAIERCLLKSPRIAEPLLQFPEWQGRQATENILRRARGENPGFFILRSHAPPAQRSLESLPKHGNPLVWPTPVPA